MKTEDKTILSLKSTLQNDKHIERRKKIMMTKLCLHYCIWKKILIFGENHLKRIKRNKLNNYLRKAKCVIKPFSGEKI